VPNEFGLSSNFSRACSREFGTTLIFGLLGFEFSKAENTIDLWKGGLKFRILNSEIPHETLVQRLIWGFWKNQMSKLSYYNLLVIW
jgi:hypothetical protein